MRFIAKTFDQLTTTELYEILKARTEIFLMEQKIICQDMDDIDYQSLHCFLQEGDRIVGYLRAFYPEDAPDCVRIGRVLTRQHGKGIGRVLMAESLRAIKERMPCKSWNIHAQTHAAGFYEEFGFQVVSDIFLEEDVPHVEMERELTIEN